MVPADERTDAAPLLEILDLQLAFETPRGLVHVVDRLSLSVHRGRTVALVGESGCGKSATALSILRLIPSPPGRVCGGSILFRDSQNRGAVGEQARRLRSGFGQNGDECDLLTLDEKQLRRIRGGRIAMIFQEPMTALNPVFSIGEQIVETVELHQSIRGHAAWECAVEALREVGIADPARRAREYPHQLSGGMRQRVMIAMALACRPVLLIADEPTTALDVTVQRQILELLGELQARHEMSVLLITHDLDLVAQYAADVYVMYAGRIVEHGPTALVLSNPLHPYTLGLLRCTPTLTAHRGTRFTPIAGIVPDPADPPPGCRFHPRCERSAERARRDSRVTLPVKSEFGGVVLRRCAEEFGGEPSGVPNLREINPGHFAACWETGAA